MLRRPSDLHCRRDRYFLREKTISLAIKETASTAVASRGPAERHSAHKIIFSLSLGKLQPSVQFCMADLHGRHALSDVGCGVEGFVFGFKREHVRVCRTEGLRCDWT